MAKTPKVASTRLSLPLGVAGTEPDDPEGSLAYATDTGRVRVKQAGGWADVSGSGGPPTGPAGGDLAGTYPNPTVTQARGLKSATTTVSVSAATAPTSGQVLTATGSAAATWQTPSGSPTGAAGGDLAGTYPNPEVAAIHETSGPTKLTIGSITTGQVLIRSGSTVIGQSGAAPIGSAGGDLAGSYPNPTVSTSAALKSATTNVVVSAATAPTSGQVLTATSTTAANWQTPAGSSPTGAAGGDLGGTYPNPTVSTSAALKSATTNVVTSAATAPTSGQVLTATSTTAATWQNPSLIASIRRGALWMPPISAHANDVEFDSSSAPSGWGWWKSGTPFTTQTVGSTINLYLNTGIGNPQVDYNTWRGSHLSFTVPYDGSLYYFLKDFTSFPSERFFWTRIGANRRSTTTALVGGDCRYSLVLMEQTSSAPALTNFAFLEFVCNAGATNPFNYRWGGVSGGVNVGGAGTTVYTTTFDMVASTFFPYLGIQKIGTDYYGMLCDDEGNIAYLGSFVISGTLRYAGIRVQEVTAPPTAWNPLHYCDFIRQIDNADGYFGLGQ